MAMADRMLARLEEEVGDEPIPTTEVGDAIHQGLADHHRSHIIGDGGLVSTIHAAKGLEFDHVLVLGGLRRTREADRSTEDERRLYYVAMTRARHTLALIDSRDNPNPYFADIQDSTPHRRAAVAHDRPARLVNLRYEVLGMKDLYIDFAGSKPTGHRIHRSLASLHAGDPVDLHRLPNGRVQVHDGEGVEVARLSQASAARHTRSRLAQVDEARVLGMVSRDLDETGPAFRERMKVETWELPLLELRVRQGPTS